MSLASPASFAPSRLDDQDAPYRQLLSRPVRIGLLVSVVAFHVGCGWALTLVKPAQIVVGDTPPMEVRMVSEETPVNINVPPPEDTPPPEPQPELESMVQPPPPDLPPPTFPVQAPPPAPPKPKPVPPKPPVPPRQVVAPAAPAPPAAPAQPAGPLTVSASQVSFMVRPSPVYPAHSRRDNEQGVVTVRVLVDTAGRPTNVTLQTSSGHPSLDESAINAVKAAQFHPYVADGVPRAVWVAVPIRFVLQ
jgi:periplasmic protein TonB